MDHMLLQLKRPPDLEQALEAFIDELSTPGSPNYHKWLTAEVFGQRFGPAQADLDTITGWLQSSGLAVNVVYPSGMVIDFSGTAGQVRKAFGTEIHHLQVNGAQHIANMSDPKIPAALAPAVVGIVSLHDFMPRPMYKPRAEYTFASGSYTYYAVTPGDLATIYNLNPLFSEGHSGQGQTIVVIEDTNVYTTADWTTFRNTFGLSSYTSGSFTQVHPAPPSGHNNCKDPNVNADDGEAILDAEYASAAAPSAAIELASCRNTVTTFGGLIALQNLINGSSPPAIVSISYGECEAFNGAAANAAYSSAYQQAVTESVSVFVSSGDEGAASCDANQPYATHGIGVSGFASTPYNVAVGGTDFGDTYAHTTGAYWNSTNTPTYASAKSYIPEIPWNDSCASMLIANYEGYATTYGLSGFCNSTAGANFLTTASGSGGPSGCATGVPATSGVVSGTCAGYAKPSWQSVFGNPSDGVRDLPDVSLFAANGVWGHYYPYCYTDIPNGGASCAGAPSTWAGAGGTSFSSPILAGIQALVNQVWGPQGNPNPVYYRIAASEYGSGGNSACNSSSLPPLRRGLASTCVFYDVTQGDLDVNCLANGGTLYNCYLPSGTNGVLSLSNGSYLPAYGTAVGWDFSTGIGTVNAYNLVHNVNW
jgi:subtilase family serine protease